MRRTFAAASIGVILVALLIIDAAKVTRQSAFSAVACANILFRDQPDATALVSDLKDTIIRQSAANDLPAALVAAVIVDHQREQTSVRAFTDCFGSALGADLSLGPAQIRMSTAAELDGAVLSALRASSFRALRAELLDPASNVHFTARELRALLDRESRSPGISAAELINSPAVMALLITEYRSGRRPTSSADTRIGANAIRTLHIIMDETLSEFGGSESDVAGIRTAIAEYIEFVGCNNGTYNGACERGDRGV